MSRPKLTAPVGALIIVLLAFLATGCGGSSKKTEGTTTSSSASITPPSSIASSGTLAFCSDITYPPEESYKAGTTIPEGSDIDIGNYIAKKMGVKARFDNTGFDGIIAALMAKKCDAVISGMNDTPERRKQVAFVDYLKVGQSFMVKKGNPENITSIDSLAGKAASVETGTTNKDFLDAQSKRLTSQGKKAIKVVTYPKDNDAANALRTGRVDAYFGDAPVVAYYIEQTPEAFALGGTPVNPLSIGIAIRKSDTELQAAVQKAIDMIYADGTMDQILTRWKLAGAVAKLK
ncbi:MAG: polar amino acid transport system substrate-binding protein [Gaiellaceae bacterium]|nr:polar amino acid transport system substrate-binding protein [Gaiellaceae bacterium]